MKNLVFLLTAILGLAGNVHAQKFWLTTYEFPGGPKTGLAGTQDSILFYSTPTMVFRSTNGGNHFDTIFTASRIHTLYLDSVGVLYAGGSGVIYVSRDMGHVWDSVRVGTYPVVLFRDAGHGHVFAATGVSDFTEGYVGDGIFYSSDAGKHWQARNTGLPARPYVDRLATDSKGRVYITVADDLAPAEKGLFYSDDLGLSWQHEPITIDGQNSIENTLFIAYSSGLSVSPEDSVYLSFEGISRADASGVLVHLNLAKHRDDFGRPAIWNIMRIGGTASWWYDAQLNNIHFARNGDRYSSRTGTVNFGGTYFSNKGSAWERTDRGLGLDATGMRSEQTFYETSRGKVYMIQAYDERLYWADTSMTAAVPLPHESQSVLIYPNPVRRGAPVNLTHPNEAAVQRVEFVDQLGRSIVTCAGEPLNAPAAPGVYFVRTDNAAGATVVVY